MIEINVLYKRILRQVGHLPEDETLCMKSLMLQESQIIKTALESNTEQFQYLSTSLRWCIDGGNAASREILILSQDVDE